MTAGNYRYGRECEAARSIDPGQDAPAGGNWRAGGRFGGWPAAPSRCRATTPAPCACWRGGAPFFGFMTRDGEQAGQPFEARTVRMKSALYGTSRIAVPLVFSRGEDGAW